MKISLNLFAALACLLSTVCTQALAEASVLQDEDGSVQLLFHCEGTHYWFDFAPSQASDHVDLRAHSEPSARRLLGAASLKLQNVSTQYQLEYSQSFAWLELYPTRQELGLPIFKMVYLEDESRYFGFVEGNEWARCSSVIGAKRSDQSDLQHLLSLADKHNKLRFGDKKAKLKSCDKRVLAWLHEASEPLSGQSGFGADFRPSIAAAYSEEVFLKFFKAKFSSLNTRTANALAKVALSANQCSDGAALVANWRFIQSLVQPLHDQAKFSRSEVAITNEGKRLFIAWDAVLSKQLEGIVNAPPEALELNALDKVQEFYHWGKKRFQVEAQADKSAAFDAAREGGHQVLAQQRIEQLLVHSRNTREGLLQLAASVKPSKSDFDRLNLDVQSDIRERIDERLRAHGFAAMKNYIAEQQGLEGIFHLQALVHENQDIVNSLSAKERGELSVLALQREQLLLRQVSNQYREQYAERVLGRGADLSALDASVQFERELDANVLLKKLSQNPQVEALNKEREAHRQELNRIFSDELVQRANAASTIRELRALRVAYSWPRDAQSQAMRQFYSAIESNRRRLAPFNHPYLNLIYDRDFDALNSEDKRVADELSLEVSQKLVSLVFAQYLVDYQFIYKRCLSSDAKPKRVTAITKALYKDSWQDTEGAVPLDEIHYFTVNPHLISVYDQLGLSKESSREAERLQNLLDSKKSSEALEALLLATRNMMNAHECDSSIMRKMEAAMLDAFWRKSL